MQEMMIVQGLEAVQKLASEKDLSSLWPQPVIALGNFDGVHLGHQKILQDTVLTAEKIAGTSMCFTFFPHPTKILIPGKNPKMIQTLEQKQESIAAQGIQVLIVQKFDLEFSRLEYDDFFKNYLVRTLKPQAIRVGCRFAFGYQRKGNGEKLRTLCKTEQIDCHVLSEFQLGEESISSSRIRTLISAGDIDKANHLLGRPYRVTGEVIHGDSRGSKLGYRTANLDLQNDRLLPQGVYACSVHLSRKEKPILAVANFGFRPTFKPQNREMIMEVHLLDFSEEVYGEKIHLDLLAFLRPEKKFANPQELRLQIEKDCQKARALFGAKT